MTLPRIVIAALAGGVPSTTTAAATLAPRAIWIPRFLSFAVGALGAYLALADGQRAPAYVLAIIAATHLVLEP